MTVSLEDCESDEDFVRRFVAAAARQDVELPPDFVATWTNKPEGIVEKSRLAWKTPSIREVELLLEPGGFAWLLFTDGSRRELREDPIKFLGLLHHMSEKLWVTNRMMHQAIGIASRHYDWAMHPI